MTAGILGNQLNICDLVEQEGFDVAFLWGAVLKFAGFDEVEHSFLCGFLVGTGCADLEECGARSL